MAAVTVSEKDETYFGNKRVILAKLSSVDNNDTWETGLSKIDAVQLNAETNAAVGRTISGGTITFLCTGTLVVGATVVGT